MTRAGTLMVKGYWIATLDVTNDGRPTTNIASECAGRFANFGGKFLVRGGRITTSPARRGSIMS